MAKLTPDYIEWVMSLNATQAQQEIQKLRKDNDELGKKTREVRRAMSELEAQGKKGSAEWRNLDKSLKEYNKEIALNKSKIEELTKRLKLNEMSAAQLGKRLSELRRELKQTSKATDPERFKELQKQITATEKAMAKATSGTRSFVSEFFNLTKMKSVINGFFMGIGQQLTMVVLNGFREGVNVIIDFEKANSKLAGVLGSTKAGIAGLTDEARRLGATTAYTASEVTGLQVELAKLGFEQGQIKAMEEAILKFALAVDTDLGSAASVAGGALRAFGLEAEDAESAMATLAIGTTTSALSFNDYATMLSTTAPVAKAFGFTLEDTVALMGALKNANFDASSAATATRNILLNLADGSGKLATALGGPVTNLDELAAGLKKLQAEGIDLATALELTDKRSVAAFETFINNADTLTTLRNGVTDCTSAFNDMYKEMGDNTQGSLNILKSTFEGLILRFYEGKGAFKSFIDMLTQFVQGISDSVGKASGPIDLLFTLLSRLFKIVGWLLTGISKLSGVIYIATAAWVGYRIATSAVVVKLKEKIALVKIDTLLTKTQTFLTKALTGAKILLAAAYARLKGNIVRANAAMRLFNITTKMNPIGLLIGAITAVIALFDVFSNKAEEAKEKTDELTESTKRLEWHESEHNKTLTDQKVKIRELLQVAEDESLSKENRLKAIKELNRICPEYNGYINQETGLYKANKKALDKYIESLERRMRLAYYKDEYEKYLRAEEEARTKFLKAEMDAQKAAKERPFVATKYDLNPEQAKAVSGSNIGYASLAMAANALQKAKSETKDFEEIMNKAGFSVGEVLSSSSDTMDSFSEMTNGASGKVDKMNTGLHTTVDRLKEINSELKQLRKADPQTDEEFEQIQAKIKALTEEKNKLMGKGGKTGKHGKNGTPGTYKEDSLDEVTAPLDLEHQRNMLNLNKRKAELTEAELIIKKSEEIIRYENEVKNALQDLAEKTDATHTKTLDKIKKQQEQSEANILAAQEAINNARVSQDEEYYGKRMEALKAFNNGIQEFMQQSLNKGIIQEEQAGIYRLNSTRLLHQAELKELQQHLAEIGQKDYYTAEQRKKIQEDLNKQIAAKNRELLADVSSIQKKFAEMTSDPVGLEGLERNLEREKAAVTAAYDAMISVAQQNGLETEALERQKQAKLRTLEFEHQQELWGIREQLGLSWQQEYDRELVQFKKLKDDELISEKEFQKKKLELQAQHVQRYFDYYSGAASSMFGAIQQAELDMSEAKYDELIRQAENAGEDTAALEEEKENRKLEIQKKYADVNFAIKVSQIVADTAVSVMKAFADLGPIGGAIAAALLTATGVAQVITAKAERDKVKRLQPKSSGAGQSMGTAERVLSGYSEGGYTGDGRRLEVAGVVHKGEYVVPQPIMGDPRVVDAVGMIEAIRRQRRGLPGLGGVTNAANGTRGFAGGGYTGDGAAAVELAGVAAELRAATEAVRNLRAYIVYQDIEKAGEVLTQARAPFTRKK